MGDKGFKSGMEINLQCSGISFKGTIARSSKKDPSIKINVPFQWTNAIDKLKPGDECLIQYKPDQSTYEEHKMILMEKKITPKKNPILSLQPFKKIGERGNLRRHKRVETFILAKIGEGGTESFSDGTISDISLSGCLLMTCNIIKIDQSIQLFFELPEDDTPIEITGVIKHLRKSHYECAQYYGVEFQVTEHDIKSKLKSLVEDYSTHTIKS